MSILQAEIHTDIDADSWRNQVMRPDGHIFLTHEWLSTRGDDGGRTVSISVRSPDGPVCAVAAGRAYIARLPILSYLERTLILESAPVVDTSQEITTGEVLEVILKAARTKGYTALEMRSFYSPFSAEMLHGLGFKAEARFETIIDLTQEEDALWNGLHTGHRRHIRRAQKEELKLRIDSSSEAYQVLRHLQMNAQEKARNRGNSYDLGDEETYRRMHQALGDKGEGRIYSISNGQEDLAAALISVFNGRAFYTLGGASEAGYSVNAPTLLIWEALLSLKAEGAHDLNLGGIPGGAQEPDAKMHGLYRFKNGFGGRLQDAAGGTCILHPTKYRLGQMIRKGMQRVMALRS